MTRIVLWYRREDYEAIKRLIPNDSDLPEGFHVWIEGATEEVNKLKALGVTVRTAIINPQEFSAWCKAAGVDHNMATLRAFAVVTYAKDGQRGA